MEGGRGEMNMRESVLLSNHILRFISSMSLKCAIELDIAGVIHRHGGSISLPDLASALCLPHKRVPDLRRLMRLMAYSGIFDVSADDVGSAGGTVTYRLNTTSALLLPDDGRVNFGITSVRPLAAMLLEPQSFEPWHALATWFRDTRDIPSPFYLTHNTSFWEFTAAKPRFNDLFNDARASETHAIMTAMASRPECREVFGNIHTLVDVGGGIGAASKVLSDVFPGVKCTVLDLPHVVAEARDTDRVKFVEGDMFHFIPPADGVFLKSVLHDWDDEDCMKILVNCKKAILSCGKGGKVILLDMILNNFIEDKAYVETQYFLDMMMMVFQTGKERSEIEWSNLFKLAGFNESKVISIVGFLSLIEVYP